MMITSARQILLALGLAGAASLSFAQGQSSGNAHGFFQAVAKTHPVLFTDYLWAAPHTYDVVAVESSGCVSRITSQAPGQQPLQSVLDWKNIHTVRVEGERDLRMRGRGVDLMLGFPSRELAVRMGNALSLVRRECDPITGYGF